MVVTRWFIIMVTDASYEKAGFARFDEVAEVGERIKMLISSVRFL